MKIVTKIEGTYTDNFVPSALSIAEYQSFCRLFSDFMQTSTSADAEIKDQLRLLRDRSRDLARNDSYVQRYLNLMQSNIVGSNGIRLSMKARNDDGSLDLLANRQIEQQWQKWCRLGSCTTNGRLSFIDCQKLFVESLARDGEVLIRHVKARDSDFNYRIEFLEADHLDEKKNEEFIIKNKEEEDKYTTSSRSKYKKKSKVRVEI